jgi:eukaryotic-like serine/threonine-protein kinase
MARQINVNYTINTTVPFTGLLLPGVMLQQRYRILETLKTSQVSTVYKAEDIQLGNRVITLKELSQHGGGTPEASEAIEASRQELLLLAGLIHPNLPRIYDYFVESQCWYFVMDFLAGETLAAYLSKRKYRPLPPTEVIDIGIQLATVLDYLHINRSLLGLKDLTLDTIWRTPDGKTVAVGGDDGIIWAWNATTGALQQTYRGHTN